MTQQASTARRLHPAHPAWGARAELALVAPDPGSPLPDPTPSAPVAASTPDPDLPHRRQDEDGTEAADRRHLALVTNPSTRSPR